MDTLTILPTQIGRWLTSADLLTSVLVLLAGGLGLLAAVSLLLLHRRVHRQRRQLEKLRGELRIFTEASTRVADTLNQLLNAADSEARAPGSSRRYLLQQARQALTAGDDLSSVGARLGLCRDEMLLLEGLRERQRAGQTRRAASGRRVDQAA